MWRIALLAFPALLLSVLWISNTSAISFDEFDGNVDNNGRVLDNVPFALEDEENPPGAWIANQTCLNCHGVPGLSMTLESGESLSLYVSPEGYTASVHGEAGYACIQCHTEVGDYPHPPFTVKDVRDASLRLYESCQRCHAGEYDQTMDSTHFAALQRGNLNAAICTDCHTAHEVKQLTDRQTGELLPEALTWIPETCAQCHNAIYQKYLTSVHGSALIGEGNPDVPTCIDCHGVHSIEDPTTAAFRLRSPQMCASCHTDSQRMAEYDLSTEVLRTYVADFHGSTVTLFERYTPDAETNKPVCYDCHGIHDIRSTADPEKGLSVRENLLLRCQACHPDATVNFPDAWLSHYIPSPERTPLVYYVDLFYRFFIPGVLGGMAVLVALDFSKIMRSRLRNWLGTKRSSAASQAIPKQMVDAVLPVRDNPGSGRNIESFSPAGNPGSLKDAAEEEDCHKLGSDEARSEESNGGRING
jgi:hypothetical protein